MKKILLSLGLLLCVGFAQASNLPNDAIYVWTSPTTYDCYLISGNPTITYDNNDLVIEVDGVEAKRINLTSVENVEVTYGIKYPMVTLNSKGYATLSFKADMLLSSNCMKAYTAKVNGDKIICTEIADGVIPAGNGVILYGTPSTSAELLAAEGTTSTLSNNDLLATSKADGSIATVPTTGYNYVLNGDKFLQYTGKAFAANKAFFNLSYNPTVSNSKLSIVFNEEDATTGITTTGKDVKSTYYDLQGRKVEKPTTGIYIVNGKKTVIR